MDVLLNNGDGTLAAPSRNSIVGSPMGLALADVDGDGRNDLVAAFDSYPIGGGVAVFLNHGHGTFAAAATYSAGEQPTSVAVADVNGDGRADLAVVSSASEVPGLNANLSVLLNQGGGTFAPAIQHSAGEFLLFVTGADLDGDGRRDLVVLDSSSNIGVLINNGDGNFSARVSYGAQRPSSAIALGDVTGDGRVDIVSATPLRYGSAGNCDRRATSPTPAGFMKRSGRSTVPRLRRGSIRPSSRAQAPSHSSGQESDAPSRVGRTPKLIKRTRLQSPLAKLLESKSCRSLSTLSGAP